MPRQSTVLQVFVASPSDVTEERKMLDSVIHELNVTWSRSLGVSFEVVKWETNARPGFGVDPQAVINAQIADDYDVFVGIFWARLGSPTNRAASGTVEEFERAFARFQRTGASPEIMLYFKDAPISPSRIDSAQLAALHAFRSSLSGKGGLYSTFEDVDGFEASVRTHLSAIAQKFVSAGVVTQGEVRASVPGEDESLALDPEEYGLLDYLEIYSARTQEMTASIEAINKATVRMGEQLEQRNADMPTQGVADPARTKKVLKRAAEEMNRYSETLQLHVTAISSARQEAFTALSSAVALMTEFEVDQGQVRGLLDTLHTTIASARSARGGLQGMRDAANALPRVTKDLNKARRAVTEGLVRFLLEIESTESTVSNIIEALERLREKNDGQKSIEV